ncbi:MULTISPECIES: hypothetical protein [Streptomyces]|uniref:Lipoprotein n=2 Tax=Streptomyces TaxID=1883 RepID=A0ABY2PHX1_9ACTN|nr:MULTISPECIES: hypothetical protein [Streptomyces]ARI53253.1 hypothetical protein A6E92_14360 [Streptomyces sp. S8]MYT93597.1 hypothetical protein [Streptomyces sp. SID8359]MYT97256.1 hypothetical protein [Streptomyces sp. SID8350]TGZ10672.1 hypothetical protein E5Z02_08710 [Streptomyces rhizosphaericola]SCK60474.1 hypothetical protein YUWDRAFT_05820 [Streptomyces sp. AmelKG-D3]
MVVQQYRDGGGARAARVLAVAGVIAVTAGCVGADGGSGGSTGGGGSHGSGQRAVAAERPLDTLDRAADVLAEAGGAEARTSMETAAGGTRVTIRGQGVYDFRTQTGRLKVVLPTDAAGADDHRPITELLAPGALYMKNRGAGVPDDKWVRIDTTALKDGNLLTGGVTDPMAAAELLRDAGDVTYVGKSELAGVTVHHYRGVADLGRAARAASPQSRGALSAAAKGFSRDAVPFDAYLDDAGRLRKVRHRFTFATEGQEAAEVTVVSTLLLYGFGAPVAVKLPDEDDIYTGEIRQG